MPKVSVVVPVYGVEKYIERCARSLFGQTLDDIEFIFVDDCTPDRSIEILNRVLEEYPERKGLVKIIRHEKNQGLPIARQSGLKVATGDYIAHCDSDDWVDVTMYEKMYNRAIECDADLVICDYMITDGIEYEKVEIGCHSTKLERYIEYCLLQRNSWSLCNKLFKKSAYYNIVFPYGAMGEDMATTMQLLWNCSKLEYIPIAYYHYYFNPNSITKKRTKENSLRNFAQLRDNTEIVNKIFAQKSLTPKMKDGLLYLKLQVKSLLLPLVWNNEYYIMWKKLYPNLESQLYLSKYIDITTKIKYLLTGLRLYPLKKDRIKF